MNRIRALLCVILALVFVTSQAVAQEFKKGDRGDLVEAMQYRLNTLGYSVGKADGDYGAKTEAAVASFQAEHGLSATGSVDEATWAALFDESITLTWLEGRYAAEVHLVPPFTSIYVDPDDPAAGNITLEDLEVEYMVRVDPGCTIEANAGTMLERLRKDYYEDNMVPNHQGTNYRQDRIDFTVDGDPACVLTVTVDFKSGGANGTQYTYVGFRELGSSYADLALCYAVFSVSLAREEEPWITADTMRQFLSSVRFSEDSSAAAPDPWAWAAEYMPELELPDFELVEDGTTPMSLMEPISRYVDNGNTEAGPGSVALYYGTKLMNWYALDLASGDSEDGARGKARMFVKYAPAAQADPEGMRDKCLYCLALAELGQSEGKIVDLLKAMGAEPLGWDADGVENLRRGLLQGFDELGDTAVISREADEKILSCALRGAAVCVGLAAESAPAGTEYEGLLILPEGTARVEANAFEGVAAEGVIIPDSCRSIGSQAFKNCPNLSVIGMPRDCDIADDAFEGCGPVTLYAPPGGTVEAFANSHPNCGFMERGY